MADSQKSQYAIRRSTRLSLEIPVRVAGAEENSPFSELCHTTLVNAHGCGIVVPRAPATGLRVRLAIVSANRQTTARVVAAVPLGGQPETWLVALEFEVPGNIWGIKDAPSDWSVEEPTENSSNRTEAGTPAGTHSGIQRNDGAISVEASGHVPAPRRWRLTDISIGACYLETTEPLLSGTSVLVSARTLGSEYLLDGVVRTSHPEAGMGVEFAGTKEHRERVKVLIAQLTNQREIPRIIVGRKESLTANGLNAPSGNHGTGKSVPSVPQGQSVALVSSDEEVDDPLLDLVRNGVSLDVTEFLDNLRAQRLGKRRERRVEIALPVILTGVDVKGQALAQRVMTVNLNRNGALLEGVYGVPSQGDRISLARGSLKEDFLVARVVDDESASGAKIGVMAVNPNTTFWDDVLEAAKRSGIGKVNLRGDTMAKTTS
jgi:hypothetical protein